MGKKSIPELLAPAGSMDAFKAAVNAGADAVYLSGKSFGARHYADNFDEAQIIDALDYAHLRNVKVYVTVNTLVTDLELGKVADYLLWLYKCGADAVILQDIGVASLCREVVPDLDMHASTQMTINSAEGVRWAYEYGFKRVVLARELSFPEVEEIVEEMGLLIELEIFAHGALCYSYSGQCLLSSVIGGRSGNRGRCAQPCRKPYQLLQGNIDEYGKLSNTHPLPLDYDYLLSTKDLALYPKLDRIINLDLDSLKIEGRMRSPEYVATVVSIYRDALDKLSENHWTPDNTDITKLKLAFNRGFTRGYLLDKGKQPIMGRETPGHRGLYLGRVIPGNENIKNTLIEIDPDLPEYMLEKGDGLVFIYPDSNRKYGMALENSPEYLDHHKLVLKTKKSIPMGSEVYLTRDISLSKEASNIIQSGMEPNIPLDIKLWLDNDNTPILRANFTAYQGKKYIIDFKADFKLETAKKSPISENQIIEQLKKTGGTPFIIKNVEIEYPGNLFTPLSKLNQFRREFIDKVELEYLNSYKPPHKLVQSAEKRLEDVELGLKLIHGMEIDKSVKDRRKTNSKNNPPMGLAVYTSSLETVRGALKGGCKRIYFEPFLWEHFNRENPCDIIDWKTNNQNILELILHAQDLVNNQGATLIWKWPSITNNESLKNLSKLIIPLSDVGLAEIMIGNMGAYKAINGVTDSILISGDAALNIWNHRSVHEFSSVLSRVTLSNELSREELKSILTRNRYYKGGLTFELIVQGNLESITSEDCLLRGMYKKDNNTHSHWGILDNKKRIFSLIIDDNARTHIMNSVELCLMDYIPSLYQLGFQDLIIDARNRTGAYAESMVDLYNQGLGFKEVYADNYKELDKLKNKVRRLSQGGITIGNFLNSHG